MNEKKQNTHPTEPEKKMAEVVPTVDAMTTESSKMPDMDEAEESSTESLKALQKEVAEKEQQINQQLEMLWARGTQQMLGNHAEPFVSTAEQKHLQQTPSIEQQPTLPEPTTPVEQHKTQEITTNKQDDSITVHGDRELVPTEQKLDEKVKKTTRKKSGASVKKKKESS